MKLNPVGRRKAYADIPFLAEKARLEGVLQNLAGSLGRPCFTSSFHHGRVIHIPCGARVVNLTMQPSPHGQRDGPSQAYQARFNSR